MAVRTKALCHPNSHMLSQGLCSRCYQKHNKLIKSKKESEFQTYVDLWIVEKERRSDERFRINAEKSNERRRGDKHRDYTLKRRYGISSDEYEEMLKSQNGACFICEEVPSNEKRLYVDHCHTSKKTRRLLCPRCNTMVGVIENSSHLFSKANQYIANYKDTRP